MKTTVHRSKFFILDDKEQVLVELTTYDWAVIPGLTVRLEAGARCVDAIQHGVGDRAGFPVLTLRPLAHSDWNKIKDFICNLDDNGAVISLT